MSTADTPISNTADVIDSRDVIARIDYLRSSWAENTGDDPDDYPAMSEDDWQAGLDEDEAHELVSLMELADEAEGYAADWTYGETLIHSDYFETYARELAEDIGAVDPNASWPLTCIDWQAAADALVIDYTDVSFDGATYYIR